ncbi:flagellar filament capping protein FliD [Lysinibacillus sp. NPDC097214]|uniref:flagellar filament capping protein FliD n=1 Tax=Lysinibacillus sp. NPDC097214 TaxID=3390584 RepID=UPI003D0060F5
MVNRVGGLASGMDIDSLVEKLMKAERAPLYKLQQQKTIYEWQRDAYRGINAKLKTFSDYTFDNMILSSNFVNKNSTVSGVNSSKVSVKAGTGAAGSLDIQSIKQLATNASTGVSDINQTSHRYAKGTDSLSLLKDSEGNPITGGTINLNITTKDADGVETTVPKTITINSNESIDSFVDQLKAAGLTDSKYDTTTGKFTIGGANVSYSFADSASEEKLKTFGFSPSTISQSIKLADGKTNASKTTLLSDLGISAGNLELKVGNDPKSIVIDSDETIQSLLDKLNATGNDIKASFNEKTGQLSITSTDAKKSVTAADDDSYTILNKLGIQKTATTSSPHIIANQPGDSPLKPTGSNVLGHLGLEDGALTLNVIQANGEMKETTFSYSKFDTIDSFIKRLNSSGAGVTALFSNGQITMTANNSGKANDASVTSEIQVVGDANSSGKQLLEKLGFLTQTEASTSGNVDLATRGQNAIYAVNGLVMESKSNSVNISGYEIKLNGTFNESNIDENNSIVGTPTNGIGISSTNDIDSMVDKIKEFVSKYNELIGGLNNQLKETRYRAYAPLTAEQRAEMSESEQKLWDEKAMSGLLRSDSILRNGLSDMRNALGGRVNGLGDQVIDTLAEMGITTSSSYNDGGKLVIDETKLRKALAEDPDRVVNTLTQDGKKNSVTGEDTRGLLRRVRDSITDFTREIERKAGRSTMTDNQFTLGKSLISTDDRITKLQARLQDVEARYWRQFTAMEKAINKANQQSSMFMQG